MDKINNDGNHTMADNEVIYFQLLCISCNRIKNPSKPPIDEQSLHLTNSERKNHNAEKPLMEWLFKKLQNSEDVTLKYFIAEGSFKFDISPYTIKTRYFEKYFTAPSGPFELFHNHDTFSDQARIRFKESFILKQKSFSLDTELQTTI